MSCLPKQARFCKTVRALFDRFTVFVLFFNKLNSSLSIVDLM